MGWNSVPTLSTLAQLELMQKSVAGLVHLFRNYGTNLKQFLHSSDTTLPLLWRSSFTDVDDFWQSSDHSQSYERMRRRCSSGAAQSECTPKRCCDILNIKATFTLTALQLYQILGLRVRIHQALRLSLLCQHFGFSNSWYAQCKELYKDPLPSRT